jgi:hypothetical protein
MSVAGIAAALPLGDVLREIYREPAPIRSVTSAETLKKTHSKEVYRVRVDMGGERHSLILKRMEPVSAHRSYLLARRWLDATGLSGAGPRLLGVVAERSGARVWHVYEDAGSGKLDAAEPDRERVDAAVDLVARVHTVAAGHPLLPECRSYGGDLGMHYFAVNVGDAIHGLTSLGPPAVELCRPDREVRDQLVDRLRRLLEELPQRVDLMTARAGPETLLHGDLWPKNIVVSEDASRVQLVDWDHVGVGPFTYDLSTLLLRFPAAARPAIFARYERAMSRAGWSLPSPAELNILFETAECARYANRIIWPAVALRVDRADWALTELREILEWFERLAPVLPV